MFPNGEIDQAVSPTSLKEKPVAKVPLQRSEAEPSTLYEAMFKPDISRVAYDSARLTEDQMGFAVMMVLDVALN